MAYIKHTKEILEIAVAESFSLANVINKLGLRQGGGTQSHIKRRIEEFGIDTSHFFGQSHYRDKESIHKKKPEMVLVKRDSGGRTHSVKLRRALIESGTEYKCAACKINSWNGKEITLQVNHKNTDWLDDRIDNLEFLCPNCHSQTEGWSGRKYEVELLSEKNYSRRTRMKNNGR